MKCIPESAFHELKTKIFLIDTRANMSSHRRDGAVLAGIGCAAADPPLEPAVAAAKPAATGTASESAPA